MNCKICGYPITGSDQFCKNCGTATNNTNVQNNGVNIQAPIQQVQPAIGQEVAPQPVNNNPAPQVIPAMNFVQGPESINQQENNMQQPINNIQQAVSNNIPAPQPVNSSQILEQNQNINNIGQPQNIEQVSNNNMQETTNQPLQQPNNIIPETKEVPQPPVSIEQPITTNNPPQDNPQPTKQKNNNRQNILVGIALVLLIAVVAFFIIKKFLNKEPQPEPNNEPQAVNKISNYTVKHNGFSFKIPTNLIYVENEGSLAITNEEDTKAAYIEVMEGLYSQLVTNKNMLQGVYQEEGYTTSSVKEEAIGNNEFITMELSANGTNILLAFTKANSMNVFGVTIYNLDNEYDYDYLNTIANILTNSEYTGETNAISLYEKLDTSIISDLLKEQE